MELFRIKRDIPFMSYGKLTTAISLITFILAVFFLVTKGLNFSVEFTGGTVMQVQYQQGADVNKKMRGDVDIIRVVRDLGNTKMVELLESLGVKNDGCQEQKCL